MIVIEDIALQHIRKIDPRILNELVVNNISLVKKYKLNDTKSFAYLTISFLLKIYPISNSDIDIDKFLLLIKKSRPDIYPLLNSTQGRFWLNFNFEELKRVFL